MSLKDEFVYTALKPKCIASNGYIGIIEIDDLNMRIKTTRSNRWKRLYFDKDNYMYFNERGIRYYLNNFFRLTEGATL